MCCVCYLCLFVVMCVVGCGVFREVCVVLCCRSVWLIVGLVWFGVVVLCVVFRGCECVWFVCVRGCVLRCCVVCVLIVVCMFGGVFMCLCVFGLVWCALLFGLHCCVVLDWFVCVCCVLYG